MTAFETIQPTPARWEARAPAIAGLHRGPVAIGAEAAR